MGAPNLRLVGLAHLIGLSPPTCPRAFLSYSPNVVVKSLDGAHIRPAILFYFFGWKINMVRHCNFLYFFCLGKYSHTSSKFLKSKIDFWLFLSKKDASPFERLIHRIGVARRLYAKKFLLSNETIHIPRRLSSYFFNNLSEKSFLIMDIQIIIPISVLTIGMNMFNGCTHKITLLINSLVAEAVGTSLPQK